MFTEPLTVTIATVAKPLNRVSLGEFKGVFQDSLGNRFSIGHTTGRRNRHTVRLDVTKTAADPFVSGVNKQYSMSALLIVDVPPLGFTDVEIRDNAKALSDWTANSANLLKVVGYES